VSAGLPSVESHNLSVGYGGEAVLSAVELRLRPGESLALVGANGSGKSTLLKAMAGLLPILSGELRILGDRPLASPSRVAYLGQFHHTGFVLPLRASEIVRMARFASHGLFGALGEEDEEAVAEAMAAVGLADIASESLTSLSGGQRQRVFIAQALARRAELLLLDEPEANLDAASRATARRLFGEAVAGGAAAVIATHDIEAAAACDYTMLLARRVVAYGRSEEVLKADPLLATFGVVGRAEGGKVVVVGCEHGHEGCEDDEH
jgi:ABC-type Mn2+/Zn2+ transport system ATPase subunit